MSSLILIGVLVALFIVWGYELPWTGFGAYIGPSHPRDTDFQRKKTLWDWLQLLIIPLILAVATIGLGLWQMHIADLQHQSDQMIAVDRRQESVLDAYQKAIAELILSQALSPQSHS